MSQLNTLFTLATRIINHTGRHLFLTGRAGTGKTTFLRHIQRTTPKKAVVVAPTGVAALNAGGVTMHSFFQLPFGMYLPGASNYLGDEWNGQLVVNRRSLFKNIRFTQEKRELLRELASRFRPQGAELSPEVADEPGCARTEEARRQSHKEEESRHANTGARRE